MNDYINKKDAIRIASEECHEFRGIFGRIKDALNVLPSADVIEHNHGTYRISDEADEWYCHYLTCNKCGAEWMCSETNFCPHCGANVINQSELTF